MSLSNRSIGFLFCFGLLFACKPSCASAAASIRPTGLRVELAANPEGIATSNPRLGWIPVAVDPSRHGLTQTAYRVLVASSPQLLNAQRGDLWDSGRVASSATRILKGGNPFLSRTRYFWKVCLWDGQGNQTTWSEPGTFLTGVLSPEDWHAHWIAAPERAVAPQPPPAPGVKPIQPPPPTLPIFRREFTVASASKVVSAVVTASGLDQYDVRINGKPATDTVLNPAWSQYKKTVYYNTWDVTRSIVPGANAIGVLLGNGMYNLESTPGRFQKIGGKRQIPKLTLEL